MPRHIRLTGTSTRIVPPRANGRVGHGRLHPPQHQTRHGGLEWDRESPSGFGSTKSFTSLALTGLGTSSVPESLPAMVLVRGGEFSTGDVGIIAPAVTGHGALPLCHRSQVDPAPPPVPASAPGPFALAGRAGPRYAGEPRLERALGSERKMITNPLPICLSAPRTSLPRSK